MTTETLWLIDKSALTRLPESPEADIWLTRINRGLVQICAPTLLEVGYSSRNGDEWQNDLHTPPLSLMPLASATPRSERRALEVQGILARKGLHRAPSIPDLLIASVAEANGLTVLHLDKDFELIAEVTGQPNERLAM